MKKITKRIVAYLFISNLIIALLGFGLTWYMLPKIYNNNEFKELEKAREYILESMKKNETIDLVNVSAVLLNNGNVSTVCKGMHGQMKSLDFEILSGKEIIKSKNGQMYISYQGDTEYGNLIVYKSYAGTSQLIKSVNLIMISIFSFSVLLSTILAIYMGNKFAQPIIILQKKAENISKGIYDNNYKVETNDEIEALSHSINKMSKELEIKDNMQREFIANVSHDLKTPLSVIRANSEVIKDGLVDGEDIVAYSENIINEVDRLNLLVKEILTLTKLRDGSKSLKTEEYQLKEFIEESYSRWTGLYANKDNISPNNPQLMVYEIKINVNNFENIFVKINNEYLFRVLSNFLSNALIHSQNNNKIILNVDTIQDGIKVGVKDFGSGIEKKELKLIWDRYYKGNKSGGMGLGLAISKEIILAHGFKFGVESEVNKETEFYFIIPNNLIKSK